MYKAGYIQKRGPKSHKAWKTRWMVTEGDGLSYYKKENKEKKGFIDLKAVTEIKPTFESKKYGFDLHTPDRVFVIACNSIYERDQWMEVIERKMDTYRKSRSVTVSEVKLTTPRALTKTTTTPRKTTMQEIRSISKSASTRVLNTGKSIAKFQTKLQDSIHRPPSTGQLLVSIEEASFAQNKVENTARPVVSAHFEDQYITSAPSKNSENPKWKDIFVFEVGSLDSKFKVNIVDSVTNKKLGFARISISSFGDGESHKEYYNLEIKDEKKVASIIGRVLISWRFEPTKQKNDEKLDLSKVLGTINITVSEARNLKLRHNETNPNPAIVLSYDEQEKQSEPIEGTTPKWDYTTTFYVSKEHGFKDCTVKVIDMDKIHRPVMGTLVIKPDLLETSATNENFVWLPFESQLESEEVQGEINIKYSFKLSMEVTQEKEAVSLEGDRSETSEGNPFTEGDVSEESLPPSPYVEDRVVLRSESIRVGTQRTMISEKLSGPFSLETALSQSTEIYDVLYKVIIIGNSGVGKTNLLGRWLENKFATTSATINVEFAAKVFNINGKIVKVQLWDTAGQEQYRSVTRSYYRKSAGAIIVYDITNKRSFDNLMVWLDDIRSAEGNEETQILLIGNKSDLDFARTISTQEGIDLAAKQGTNFMETSALNGNNVQKAFQIVLQDIHNLAESKLQNEKPTIDSNTSIVLNNPTTNPVQEQGCCVSEGSTSDSLFSSISSFFSTDST
eukprot:TRINITY_DN1271_c0_g1_i1.p1 TRINITY_DN1271_c0_g1~~TRINITY_DN1271_c0_g1_i1.p1  ORF type:complete len:732 (-),score=144.06 TRINITY_DN1271_c0_g1_i1:14-2209(-)